MRTKIALTAAAITALNVSTMVILSAQNQYAAAQENGYLAADSAAADAAQQVILRLSGAYATALNNANVIMGLHNKGLATRTSVNAMLRKNLEDHPEFVGMYTGWEPNAFDNLDRKFKGNTDQGATPSGQYMPYFQWDSGQVRLNALVDFEKPGAGDYYQIPKRTLRPSLIDPYPYQIGDKQVLMSSVILPLMSKGKFIGICGVDIELERLQAELSAIRPLKTGQVYLYAASRQLVSGPENSKLGSVVSTDEISNEQWDMATRSEDYRFQDDRGMSRFLQAVQVKGLDAIWMLDVRIPRSTILEHAQQSRNVAITAGLMFLLLDVTLIGWIVLRQLRPLYDIKAAIEGTGDALSANTPGLARLLNRADEIGMVARSFEALKLKLSDSFDTLEANVHKRTQELSNALSNLKRTQNSLIEHEKLAALGAMVAGVSHELNTPIGNALTITTTLQAKIAELEKAFEANTLKRSTLANSISDLKELLQLSVRSLIRSSELISDFKQVARDQTSEHRRTFDLRGVIDENLSTLMPGLGQYGMRVDNQVPDGIACDSYPGPLGQIVNNIVQNAAFHAFKEAGGTLTITSALNDGEITLVFHDNGVGMSPSVQNHIFEPFFTTRLGTGGSGLGLSIVKRIATNILGGNITVSSKPDVGTRFELTFPAVATVPALE